MFSFRNANILVLAGLFTRCRMSIRTNCRINCHDSSFKTMERLGHALHPSTSSQI